MYGDWGDAGDLLRCTESEDLDELSYMDCTCDRHGALLCYSCYNDIAAAWFKCTLRSEPTHLVQTESLFDNIAREPIVLTFPGTDVTQLIRAWWTFAMSLMSPMPSSAKSTSRMTTMYLGALTAESRQSTYTLRG